MNDERDIDDLCFRVVFDLDSCDMSMSVLLVRDGLCA